MHKSETYLFFPHPKVVDILCIFSFVLLADGGTRF